MSRHCFLCDAPLPEQAERRWVDTTGVGYGRIYISRRGLSGGSATRGRRTGLRTVCASCAGDIDARQARSDHFAKVAAECIAIVVIGSILVHCIELGYPDRPPAPQAVRQEASTRGPTND